MVSRFHQYLRRLQILNKPTAIAFCAALLPMLTGYARNSEWNCQAFIDKCQSRREAGDDEACIRWARYGQRQCRAEGASNFLRLNLLNAESLTASGYYPAALQALAPDPPQGQKFATLRARRLNDQASIEIALARYEPAAKLLDSATNEASGAAQVDAAMLSTILSSKISLYGETLDLDKARDALDQLSQMKGVVDKAHLLADYGYVRQRSAQYEQAASYYESALAEPGTTPLDEAGYKNNLAGIYYHLGDLDRALNLARQAENGLDKSGDRSALILCLNTLGLIYKDSGDLPRAKDNLTRALALAEELKENRSIIEVNNNLASLAIESHDGDKAEELNRRALESEGAQNDQESRQYSRISKARILAGKHDYANALVALDEVIQHGFDNPNPRIDAEVEYMDVYRRLRNEPQVRAHYETARALSESVRSTMQKNENKLAWFESQNELNQEWVRFLVEFNHSERALEAAESSRARILLEHLGRHGHPAGQVSAYQALARSEGAALISYWLMADVSYAWIITADRVEFRKLPGEQAIASLVARYQALIRDGNDPLISNNTAAADLEKAVLEPILPLLGGAKRVIIVPDAQLNALNFETLPVQGRYWIESVTVTVAPALDLLDGRKQPASAPSILALGDPSPTAEFPRLPEASRELDSVAQAFPASTILRGTAATPAAYLKAADGHKYIEIVAHAEAIADHPLDSAVILSSGRLTARELLHHPIHAELVTLSACRSAGVRSYHGEGMVGLAWVFLQTGAHTVIAGLWDASDDATADLMTELYRRISRGEQPVSALREAKLEMIQRNSRFSIPYYWGPFQYYRGASN